MPSSRIARRHDDPGLQPERTSLSWYRTLFLIVGVSMLFLRLGFVKNDLILVAGSIILLLCNIGVCIYAYQRNLFDVKSTVLTSYGSVIVKKMICFAIIFSALVFALSIIMSSYNRIFESYLI
ncbi:DUF202 domain-containing protein [Psychromonas sp. SR45-3]|uniref:DUF202 domain-containing protein n=1 Tax=Psychromonas sp. SR45-3 TaxID=2760930 RepID=UPI0015FAF757|nr:DUF202 domain-containing protein [Psychromonas sp. SR45-3]MBB1272457.1 DUF202 domain-containing protein [Psychromonas sp. SR45-3]